MTITAAGTYLVKGSASDATLTIDAAKTDKIQLVFDGVSLSCTDGPAVYIKCADKVFITLADGSENFLSDGDSYEIVDDGSTLDAALFSKEDLTINGNGSLTVNGNYKHGIRLKGRSYHHGRQHHGDVRQSRHRRQGLRQNRRRHNPHHRRK